MAAAGAISRVRTRALSETGLLLSTAALYVVYQIGAFIDAGYHFHQGFEIESFFTWQHAVLYAGFLGSPLPAVFYLLESRAMGLPRGQWLPAGYPLVLAGAVVFGIGGNFDFAWHSIFGFETNQEALVGPAHLWLVYASIIGVIGFVWAAVEWRRRVTTASARRAADLVVALSFALCLRDATFVLQYSHPFEFDFASGGRIMGGFYGATDLKDWSDMAAHIAGTNGMILYGIFLALFLVLPLRVLRLPSGTITLVVLWDAAMAGIAAPELIGYGFAAALATAIVGEAIWAGMGRGRFGGRDGIVGYWTIAFAVPATQITVLVTLLGLTVGLAWSVPLVAGSPFLAGVFGLTAAMLAIPPRWLVPDPR